jgi:hypothetical protein
VRFTAREAVMNLIIQIGRVHKSGSTAWFGGPHTCNVRGRTRAPTPKRRANPRNPNGGALLAMAEHSGEASGTLFADTSGLSWI